MILEPLEVIGVEQIAAAGVIIRVRFKTVAGAQWGVKREFFRRMKARFDERGIVIPMAQTVFIERDGDADEANTSEKRAARKQRRLEQEAEAAEKSIPEEAPAEKPVPKS